MYTGFQPTSKTEPIASVAFIIKIAIQMFVQVLDPALFYTLNKIKTVQRWGSVAYHMYAALVLGDVDKTLSASLADFGRYGGGGTAKSLKFCK